MSPQAELDRTILLEQLQGILSELYGKVTNHLSVSSRCDPSLENFSSSDGHFSGSLQTFAGPEIEWLVYSWFNAAPMKFSTMRLSIWLGPQIQVPHLVFEFGTVPQLFFYMDYLPRVDLWSDLSYVEQYYEPAQSTYLKLRDNPSLSLFVSKGLYIRQVQSPAHLCFTCPGTEESLTLVRETAQAMCDRWLTWVDRAEPVPSEAQVVLAKRDRQMRRIAAERDPGNAAVAKVFGNEFADRLVRSLWNQELATDL